MLFAIVSDTHGNVEGLKKLIDFCKKNYQIDKYIHLGDGIGDMFTLIKAGTVDEQECSLVKGNCDVFSGIPEEQVLEVEGLTILLCHGHRYEVKFGLDRILYRAQELGASIVLHGHTHIPFNENVAGIQVINPGSLKEIVAFTLLEISKGKYHAVKIWI